MLLLNSLEFLGIVGVLVCKLLQVYVRLLLSLLLDLSFQEKLEALVSYFRWFTLITDNTTMSAVHLI